MKLLIVGAGGGGGTAGASQGGGGGGGGAVVYNASSPITNNTYTIIIAGTAAANTNGGVSTFGALYAGGGGAGGSAGEVGHAGVPLNGNGGGGGSGSFVGGSGSGTGYTGGTATAGHAGGGAGAAANGGISSEVTGGGAGGAGTMCDITGTNLMYGEGGGGGYSGSTTGVGGVGAYSAGNVGNGLSNRGGGGGGNYNNYGTGTGGSGVVIVSYLTADWGTCTGGSISTNGSYTVHTFTESGTFTVVSKIKKIAGKSPISALALDSTSYGLNGASPLTTITWAHTIGAGTDRCLFVLTPISQATNVTGVTYGGTALTLSIGVANGNNKAAILYMINPPVGTANIVVTFDTSLAWYLAGAVSFFGVDQSVPLTNVVSSIGTAQNRSFEMFNPYSNTYLLECMGDAGTTNSAASGQTVFLDAANRVASYDTGVTSPSFTQSWTGDTSMPYAWVAGFIKCSRQHFKKIGGVLGTSAKKVSGKANL